MRKSFLIFIVSALLLIPLGGYARSFNVTFRNDNVEAALNILQKETGYDFVYRKDLINGISTPVSGSYRNVDLDYLLQHVVTAQMGLGYEVIDKTVILRKGEPASSEKTTVSGTVTDEHGDPVIGASVIMSGSTKGVPPTWTDVLRSMMSRPTVRSTYHISATSL